LGERSLKGEKIAIHLRAVSLALRLPKLARFERDWHACDVCS